MGIPIINDWLETTAIIAYQMGHREAIGIIPKSLKNELKTITDHHRKAIKAVDLAKLFLLEYIQGDLSDFIEKNVS